MRWDGSSKGVWNWNTASVRHRFERQRPDVEEVPRHCSKKNTKRWCKGKVGVEHQNELAFTCSFITWYRCKVCGRHVYG